MTQILWLRNCKRLKITRYCWYAITATLWLYLHGQKPETRSLLITSYLLNSCVIWCSLSLSITYGFFIFTPNCCIRARVATLFSGKNLLLLISINKLNHLAKGAVTRSLITLKAYKLKRNTEVINHTFFYTTLYGNDQQSANVLCLINFQSVVLFKCDIFKAAVIKTNILCTIFHLFETCIVFNILKSGALHKTNT